MKKAILKYLISYENDRQYMIENGVCGNNIYLYLLKVHQITENKILVKLHFVLSFFRFLFVVIYILFVFFRLLYYVLFYPKKSFVDDSIYIPIERLLILRSKNSGLFKEANCWLFFSRSKDSMELDRDNKNVYMIYDFISLWDVLCSLFLLLISFFVLWNKFGYNYTIFHYNAFLFFVFERCLNNIPTETTLYFSNQVDRWIVLLDKSKQSKKVLIQHGLSLFDIPRRYRFSNVETLYAFNEENVYSLLKSFFRKSPKNTCLFSDCKLNLFSVKNKFSILIISYSPFYLAQEEMLIKCFCNQGLSVYVKIHPNLKGDVFNLLLKKYSFNLIEDDKFPDVDVVVSYKSTLALEYELLGKKVLYHTDMDLLRLIDDVIKISLDESER